MTPDRDESRVREEEDAAAAEAGRIGGRSGMEEMDEAERAAAEQGGGEAEGFEEAERLLREEAEHGDVAADPLDDRPAPEAEPDPSVHGEPDEAEPRDT